MRILVSLLVCLAVISCMAMAQTINGVSIGGTPEGPTLVNASGKSLMAYVVQRMDTNNVNRISTIPDIPDLIMGRGIPGGPLGLWSGVIKGHVNPVTGQQIMEGDVIQWVLKAVVFSDGKFYGDPKEFERLKAMFGNFRSFAQGMLAAAPSTWPTMLNSALSGPFDLSDRNKMQDQGNLAQNLQQIGAGLEPALIRLAALQTVVKGN